jgi:hypothetical protein
MIERHKLIASIKQEQRLRSLIRKDLKRFLENKKATHNETLLEEKRFRKIIQSLIKEIAKTDVATAQPHKNTGINVLEDLLRNIIPTIEEDFKALTSALDQRKSFRAHILNAIKNTLKPVAVVANVPHEKEELEDSPLEEQDLTIKVDDTEDEKFIPVRAQDLEPEEEEEEDTFSIEGEDLTGRNFASLTFNKVEKQILDAYESLANKEDAKLFYDYLLTNLKLYFDKFEDELKATVGEPESPDYEAPETIETEETIETF